MSIGTNIGNVGSAIARRATTAGSAAADQAKSFGKTAEPVIDKAIPYLLGTSMVFSAIDVGQSLERRDAPELAWGAVGVAGFGAMLATHGKAGTVAQVASAGGIALAGAHLLHDFGVV